jgi:hypothetical protein
VLVPRKGAWFAISAAAACIALLLGSAVLAGSVLPTPISQDPYTNPESQHKTQVEPDSFGHGNTVVTAFQTGRVFGGGASNIGWATTTNAGRTWTTGMLPGTTIHQGGPWSFISDPAVAYDPEHDVWMISTLVFGMGASTFGAPSAILTSRSTDGGLTWQNPVPTSLGPSSFYDKNWIACDTWPGSPHYGNCYTEWDDTGLGNRILMSTSTDGGLTWSPPASPGDLPSGLGGQPVVQPNGTVHVPYTANYSAIRSFRSTDGGVTWMNSVQVAPQIRHAVAGGLRAPPLPSAEVDGSGKVYVVWHDCAFRSGCPSNDIVMSTSTDGTMWTPKARIPIDPVDSTVDHFLPGIGADRASFGANARLALAYYYYPVSGCNVSTCQLTAGFVSSLDGGATWSAPKQISAPMNLSWIANTSQGRMVGDYVSTSFADGYAFPVFVIAKPPTGSVFSERAAAARFDVTASARPTTRTRRDRIRSRTHNRPADDGLPTAN